MTDNISFREHHEATLEYIKSIGVPNVLCRMQKSKERSHPKAFKALMTEAAKAQTAVCGRYSLDDVRALTEMLREQNAEYADVIKDDAQREAAVDRSRFCQSVLRLANLVARLLAREHARKATDHLKALIKLVGESEQENQDVATLRLHFVPMFVEAIREQRKN